MLEHVKIVLIVLKKCDLSSLYQNASSEREILASSSGQADRRAENSMLYIRVRVRVKVEVTHQQERVITSTIFSSAKKNT